MRWAAEDRRQQEEDERDSYGVGGGVRGGGSLGDAADEVLAAERRNAENGAAPADREAGGGGWSGACSRSSGGPAQNLLQGLPGAVVEPAELAGDGLEVVAFLPVAADQALVVVVGVDGLQHGVSGARPRCDPRVRAVEVLQALPLAVGQGQRSAGEARAGAVGGGTCASRNCSHCRSLTWVEQRAAISAANSSASVCTICSAWRAGPSWARECRLCLTLNSWPCSASARARVLSQTVSVTVRVLQVDEDPADAQAQVPVAPPTGLWRGAGDPDLLWSGHHRLHGEAAARLRHSTQRSFDGVQVSSSTGRHRRSSPTTPPGVARRAARSRRAWPSRGGGCVAGRR